MNFRTIGFLLLIPGILAPQACRSIPEKISDGRLTNLSELERTSLDDLARKVILTKHRKDAQKLREDGETLRLQKMKLEHDRLPAGTQKQDKAREIDGLKRTVDVEKRKTRITGLELGAAIAALERQKARIISVRSKSEMNSEAYETESEYLENDLAGEKSELARREQENRE